MNRLRKEKHEVYVITGRVHQRQKKPSDVLLEYNFTYTDDNLMYICNSIAPDIVIFTGAMDDNFKWEGADNSSALFTAALMNALINAAQCNVSRLVYLSSAQNYRNSVEDQIYSIGEQICQQFTEKNNIAVDIVRMGEIYGCYKKAVMTNSVAFSFAWNLLQGKPLTVLEEQKHQLLYIGDAVDWVYRIIVSQEGKIKKKKGSFYYVVPKTLVEERQILEVFEKLGYHNIQAMPSEIPVLRQEEYSATGLEPFKVCERYPLEPGIETFLSDLKRSDLLKAQEKERKKEQHPIRKFFRCVLENILFFLLVQLFVNLTKNSEFHQTINVYLFYVLIISVIYGFRQGILSFVLSSSGYLYFWIQHEGVWKSFNNYQIYLWILQIFAVAVLAGMIRDNYARKKADLKEDIEYYHLEYEEIKQINQSNVDVKNIYEKRLINYKDSFAKMYEVVKELDTFEVEELLFKAVRIIARIMGSKDVAIYACDQYARYARLMASTSIYARRMGKSVELAQYTTISQKLGKREIYLNNSLEADYPVMVGGIYDQDKLQMMIIIWSLPLEKNSRYEVNLFSVLNKLIERYLTRAYQFMESIRKESYYDGTNVMNTEAFEAMVKLYRSGASQQLLEYSLIEIVSYEQMSRLELYKKLEYLIRDTDYIGVTRNDMVQILLTNTNEKDVEFVEKRFYDQNIFIQLVETDRGSR